MDAILAVRDSVEQDGDDLCGFGLPRVRFGSAQSGVQVRRRMARRERNPPVNRSLHFALAAIVSLASASGPALAQRFAPALPSVPRTGDYVETICTGGIDGRYDQTRLLAAGRMQKATRRAPMISVPVPRADVAAIQRDLDRANFDRRSVAGVAPRISDGVTCTLSRRRNGRVHSVTLPQEAADLPAYRDLARVIARVDAIARRAITPELRAVEAP